MFTGRDVKGAWNYDTREKQKIEGTGYIFLVVQRLLWLTNDVDFK